MPTVAVKYCGGARLVVPDGGTEIRLMLLFHVPVDPTEEMEDRRLFVDPVESRDPIAGLSLDAFDSKLTNFLTTL